MGRGTERGARAFSPVGWRLATHCPLLLLGQECSNLFATGGGERLAEEISTAFLGARRNGGALPLSPQPAARSLAAAARSLAHLAVSTFQGRVPIDPELGASVGEGKNYLEAFEGSGTYDAVMKMIAPLDALSLADAKQEPSA